MHGHGRVGRGSRVSHLVCYSPRIVCTIDAAKTPITAGVVVDVNGKLGHSPPHVLFTYQVTPGPGTCVGLAVWDRREWDVAVAADLWTVGGCVLTRGGAEL